MELKGTVQNGVIVVDSPQPLPEGTRVKIVVESPGEPAQQPTLRERLLKHAGTVPDLPPDMAEHTRPLHPRDAEAMRTVFADTHYFLALFSPRDAGHAKALAFTSTFAGRLVTTGWILMEVADALASTPQGRAEFLSTRDDLRADPDVRIIVCDDTLMEEGIGLYAQRPDKKWSLTDCISFVVMQREGLTEALTGDHHFEQAGFVALLK